MHAILPRLILPGALISVGLIGAIALFAGAKLAAHLDPASHESHLPGFIVVISSLAVAVASAFPIFGRAVPWASARLKTAALEASGSFPSSRIRTLTHYCPEILRKDSSKLLNRQS